MGQGLQLAPHAPHLSMIGHSMPRPWARQALASQMAQDARHHCDEECDGAHARLSQAHPGAAIEGTLGTV